MKDINKLVSIGNKLREYEKLNAPEAVSLKDGVDFANCFTRAGDMREELLHTFTNGKARGLTTHIPSLDPHMTWKPGFLYCITGWPQHGKTEFTQYAALAQSVHTGAKWGIHSPENFPAGEFFDSLAHAYLGKSVDPHYKHNLATRPEYLRAIDFLHEHFFFIYHKGAVHSPEFLREATDYIHDRFKLFGVIKDPWNKLAHITRGLRDDQYLAQQLPQEQQQARENNLVQVLCVHPRSPGRLEKGEGLPIPDQYMLAGGQMWDNMCDVIAAVHRPNYHMDKTDTEVIFVSHKIKKQRLVGVPGTVSFNFNPSEARYYDIAGRCSLPAIQGQQQGNGWNSFPTSNFEEPNF